MSKYHIRIVLDTSDNKDTFTPTSLFQHLPAQTPKNTARQINPKQRDYRYGPVRLDWLDFESMNAPLSVQRRGTATAAFVPTARSKSGSTNLPEGIVHVYRELSIVPKASTSTGASTSTEASTSTSIPNVVEETQDSTDSVMLAVLAVPSWMTPSDFLAFVAPAAESITHLRMIRDSLPNRSIVVVNFPSSADAAEFAEAYNGKPFNSMDSETCHVVRVSSVKIDTDDSLAFSTIKSQAEQVGTTYELPTCPVCLERMDSAVTGLITVPCSHTFHCMCLSKWGDSRCPVCRYSQTQLALPTPGSSSSSSRSRPSPSNSHCVSCSSQANLWICLICGNIGCGRYGLAHAHAHYVDTTHLYAMELETQRVWDYAGDGYVHRLIRNKADGKLVELPSFGAGGDEGEGRGPGRADVIGAEKIEAIGIEYSYLLTSQLDSQREHYEQQANELREQLDELKGVVAVLSNDVKEQKVERVRLKQEEEERVEEVWRDKIRAEKRAEKAIELSKKLEKDLREERTVSESLLKNLANMKARVEEGEKEIGGYEVKVAGLEEQLRDLMFFLEARTKIENAGEGGGGEMLSELAGGSIEIPPPSLPARKKKKRPKK